MPAQRTTRPSEPRDLVIAQFAHVTRRYKNGYRDSRQIDRGNQRAARTYFWGYCIPRLGTAVREYPQSPHFVVAELRALGDDGLYMYRAMQRIWERTLGVPWTDPSPAARIRALAAFPDIYAALELMQRGIDGDVSWSS